MRRSRLTGHSNAAVAGDVPARRRRSTQSVSVNPTIERCAAYAWRLIAIGVVALAALWVLRELRVVAFPVVVALFVARVLSPVAGFLHRHGWRRGLAAAASMLLFFVVIGGLLTIATRAFADELRTIRPTITEGFDDLEDWLVEDSPWDVSRSDVDDVRRSSGERFDSLLASSDGSVTGGAIVVGEVATGAFLALILTFFMIRDGRRLADWAVSKAGADRRPRLRRTLDAAWNTLAGYLRGAAVLGVIESIAIGLALVFSGASLVAPVMIITFLAAFVPIIGAIGAGLIATLVALVTGGIASALVVAVVAFLVQQFDNELLAPVIYSRALNLHPVVILVSVVAGGALFGLAGTLLAVPLVAVATSSARAMADAEPLNTDVVADPSSNDRSL